jgi:UDP-sugar diphosphatase
MNASLTPLGVQLDTQISTTSFDLEMAPLQVTGLGSLCADSVRNVANALELINYPGRPVDLAIVASGTIRDALYQGNTGVITFTDVYNCLPLGISPYQPSPPGYPLMHAYLNGLEIYTVCEVGLSLSQAVDSDYYLNFSGIKIDYNPAGAPTFTGVEAVYLYDSTDHFCTGPTTPIYPNNELYHVVVDFSGLQMVNVLTAYGFPLSPKDATGNPISPADYINFRIDADSNPGVQELKEWMALLNYLLGLGGSIPPEIYGSEGVVMGRVNFVE